jgi:phage major head subunit gpT-like protein
MAAVKPIEQLGVSSQRAAEQFVLKYNTSLASQPKQWAENAGDVLTGNSLKETYPVAIDNSKYFELTGQSGDATDIEVKDITVTKRRFANGARADTYRLERGDHAYIQQWGRRPAAMARARQFLRNRIVRDLIATGEVAGSCALDGAAFFDAAHPINPFDDSIKDKAGSATFSNFQASATPLNPTTLTQEKDAMKLVPGPDGEEMGLEPDIILIPTSLDSTAYHLISVKDLILEGALTQDTGAGVGTMGTVRNVHFGSGMKKVRAPELPGTDLTADWYLIASNGLAMDLFPWVIVEDTSEEMRIWDKTSDYWKDTSHIKLESRVLMEAAFLFPHAIRKISGS